MIRNQFDEIVFDQSDLIDLVMQGRDIVDMPKVTVADDVPLETLKLIVGATDAIDTWKPANHDGTDIEFHKHNQSCWHMPQEYRQLDIAKHVLSLCTNDAQLQRAAQELMLFQDRDLFDLLRYLKYLVDVMTANNVIWGVGRGSSVASYVLFLLGVHRIDSMYYDLDPQEFLR